MKITQRFDLTSGACKAPVVSPNLYLRTSGFQQGNFVPQGTLTLLTVTDMEDKLLQDRIQESYYISSTNTGQEPQKEIIWS